LPEDRDEALTVLASAADVIRRFIYAEDGTPTDAPSSEDAGTRSLVNTATAAPEGAMSAKKLPAANFVDFGEVTNFFVDDLARSRNSEPSLMSSSPDIPGAAAR
jgi:hypothetical protein